MKKIVVLIAFSFILCGCSGTSVKNVTCDEAKKILNDELNSVLIDVRTEPEFKEGHLENAKNIPLDKLENGVDVYGSIDFDTPIIVYCKSGKRSSEAAKSLVKKGYKQVYDLGAMSNCD